MDNFVGVIGTGTMAAGIAAGFIAHSTPVAILGRNKDKLAVEVKQSKELVFLIRKSTTKELTKEEKEAVKSQFLDVVKSMPSLAIFMLPGGAVLLPLILKIIPDLMPSAFRDNEIEK